MKAGIYPMVMRTKGPLIAITTPFGRYGPSWEAYNDKVTWHTIMISAYDKQLYTPEQIEKMLRSYGDDQALARQEILAEFISDDNAVIPDKYYPPLFRVEYEHATLKIDTDGKLVFDPGKNVNWNPLYRYHMAIDYGWDTNRAVIMVGHREETEYIDMHGAHSTEQYIKVDFIASFLRPDPSVFQNIIVMACKEFHVNFIMPDGKSVGTSELLRLRKRLRKSKVPAKIFKSGKRPSHGTADTRSLGFITSGGEGVYSKINLVAEMVACLDKKEFRLPPAGIDDENRNTDNEAYETVQEMRAFSRGVSPKGSNITFGRGVNEEPDDRVLTVMYLIMSFTKGGTRPVPPASGATPQMPLLPDKYDKPPMIVDQYSRSRRNAKTKAKDWGR